MKFILDEKFIVYYYINMDKNLKNIKPQDDIINYWSEIRSFIQYEKQKQMENSIEKNIFNTNQLIDEINIKEKIFQLINQIEKYDENIWEKIRIYFFEKDYDKVMNILKNEYDKLIKN